MAWEKIPKNWKIENWSECTRKSLIFDLCSIVTVTLWCSWAAEL